MQTTMILCMLAVLSGFVPAQAQEGTGTRIDEPEKKQVIDSISRFMTDYYVFPEPGQQMAELIRKNHADARYADVSDPREFASMLTQDLRSVNNDRHIGVSYAPERIELWRKAESDSTNTELEDRQREEAEFNNFNFKEVKILPGNVGYLKFNSFQEASLAGPTAIAAMNFLANTDALIIDLRDNGGGSPSLIQLITSYFFDETEHLNSFYIREGERTQQFWTLPYVPGKKMTDTELFVLTSGYTFSGAEEFTYNLKNMERATIVGETTGGGAHPVSPHIINDNFAIGIPFGKAVNPVTNANWEGTGIEPHVKTTRSEAFDRAYLLALEELKEKHEDATKKQVVSWAYDGLAARLNPVNIGEKTMKKYVGTYGPRKITLEEGTLYYQREDRPRMKMVPMSETIFGFEEIDYFRLEVILENGDAKAVVGHYDNGRTDRNDKS